MALVTMTVIWRGFAVAVSPVAAFLSVGIVLCGLPSASMADIDPDGIDAEATLAAEKKVLRQDEEKRDRVDTKLRRLNQERSEIKFRKRTGDPFRSARTLRNDLRRNEAQQGWYKNESRRLDFKVRRQERKIRQRGRP